MAAPEGRIGDKQSMLRGIAARLWWMLFGNVLLAFCAIFIFQNGGGFLQTTDWVFWIVLVSMVLVRYVDIKFLDGCTATGARASIKGWGRYTVLLTACSIALWVLAHVAGHLVAARTAQS
jgi:hypothetical protein